MGIDALHNADETVAGDHGRAAVTHERQRDADDRQARKAHAEILRRLRDQYGGDADAHGRGIAAAHLLREDKRAHDQHTQHENDEQRAEKAEFFTGDGKNKVGVHIGHLLILGAARKACAEKAARSNGIAAHERLKALVGRVALGMEASDDAPLLIIGEMLPQKRRRRDDDARRREEIPEAEPRAVEHGGGHEHEDQRRTEVALEHDQPDDDAGMRAELHERKRVVDLVPHKADVLGKRDDIQHLDKLGGLDADGQPLKADPALVAVTRADEERDAEHEDADDKEKHRKAVGDLLIIDRGNDRHGDKAERRRAELHIKILRADVVGCTRQRDQADKRQYEHCRQHDIVQLAQLFIPGDRKRLHARTPLFRQNPT